jgi:dTDP-glucose 4,6-dehydratase
LKLLLTGGCGFIGANFIRHWLERHPQDQVTNLDLLTYAGNPENLRGIEEGKSYHFVHGDICDRALVGDLCAQVDALVHMAAESHVDRSIADAGTFVHTNVQGTQTLLEAARQSRRLKRFLQVSTDEVYGSLGPTGTFTEESPLQPNSPYSASKAGADLIALAYAHTYGLPVLVTRCSNNYGPYQNPEKLIPLFVTNALRDLPLPLYGDGLNVRDWLHVGDHCAALERVLEGGTVGSVYNIGGNSERTNRVITKSVLEELHKPDHLVRLVRDRPGHDRRYAIDASRLRRELGWEPAHSFEQGLKETIAWYRENRWWWEPLVPPAEQERERVEAATLSR